MFELIINNETYQFNFGMGFLREINKKVSKEIDGLQGVKKDIGLQYYVAGVLDGDIEALVDVLDIANKGQNPRLNRSTLDSFIDDENTDVDKLFEDVLDFLKRANATKKTVLTLLQAIETEQNK